MSSFGKIFKIMTFGESHAKSVGVVIDGFPSNFKININKIQNNLDRRRPGQNIIATERNEKDKIIILSGLNNNNMSIGSPISIIVNNLDQKMIDYEENKLYPRPGHSDLTYKSKYTSVAESGGGRASARETLARIIAGSIAQQYLKKIYNIEISAIVKSIKNISISENYKSEFIKSPLDQDKIDVESTFYKIGNYLIDNDNNKYDIKNGKFIERVETQLIDNEIMEPIICRCPDKSTAAKMISLILKTKDAGDSLGGVVCCVISNMPTGIGEPCFDKLNAKISHGIMSIPSCVGIEFGLGFDASLKLGSEYNDLYNKNLKPITNNAGGINGGISNGENIYFNVCFHPISSIKKSQTSYNYNGDEIIINQKGRHDCCVLCRATPIIEAMTAITILDLILINNRNN